MEKQLLSKPGKTPQSPSSGPGLALQVLVALSEALPRQGGAAPLSPEALGFMADGLTDLPADALRLAAGRARNACRWFPTVAELRALAGVSEPSAEDLGRAEELAAFDQAGAWIRRYRDRLRNPVNGAIGWTDAHDYSWLPEAKRPPAIEPLPVPIENAVRRAGGLDALWEAMFGEQTWFRRDFCEAYRLTRAIDAAHDGQKSLPASRGDAARLADGLGAKLAMGRAL